MCKKKQSVWAYCTLVFFTSLSFSIHARISFTNNFVNLALKEQNSKVVLNNPDKITGWSELSIVKKSGKKSALDWDENYTDGVVISQEGSEEPALNSIIANSNTIISGVKNNSNTLLTYSCPGPSACEITVLELQQLEKLARTVSQAQLYCCKNTSNALSYGLKNNSNAIGVLERGSFSGPGKQEFLNYVRTTSNAFLYCCKNTSNALAYGLRTNSNGIGVLRRRVFSPYEKQDTLEKIRTTSNGLLYCCKNTSNALLFGVKNNSTALMNIQGVILWSIEEERELYEKIRVNSSAFVYCCKNTSNALVNLSESLANFGTIYDTHEVYDTNTQEQNFVFFKNGFTVKPDKTLTLKIPVPVSGNINLGQTGTINLQNDLLFASNAYLTGGGKIDGNGFALVLSCTFAIPANETLEITSDTIINGHGTTFYLEPHAQITIDNNVTLTLKNVRIKNTRNRSSAPMIDLLGAQSTLTLMNCELALAGDYSANNGHVFIHDDVIISGTSSFIYNSGQTSYIVDNATWAFDKNTRFYYDPSVSDNSLVHMLSKTSGMYFDGATVEAGDMGIRLSTGSLYLDNNVLLKCPVSTQIIFGNSSKSNGDLDAHVLGGGYIEIEGVVFDDSRA